MNETYAVGDTVRYRPEFLRDAGWRINYPTRGVVRDIIDDGRMFVVEWPDGATRTMVPSAFTLMSPEVDCG